MGNNQNLLRIGVFPCGTEIGMEMSRQLKFSKVVQLVGLNSNKDASYLEYENGDFSMPTIYDPTFLQALKKTVEDFRLDFVFPAHDDAIIAFSKFAEEDPDLSPHLVAPPKDIAEILRSKRLTAHQFKDIIPIPDEIGDVSSLSAIVLPVFVKPDQGQGSRGAKKITDLHEAASVDLKKNVMLEFLPGDEYTIDCFSDKNHELVACFPRRRGDERGGIAKSCISEDEHDFISYAKSINERLRLRGPWFFQMKRDTKGCLKLLEIAARIAGSSGFSVARGFNFMEAAIYDLLGYPIKIENSRLDPILMGRSLNSIFKAPRDLDAIYVDLDDTLIVHEKLNSDLFRVLIEAKNYEIPIKLITRHKCDVEKTLDRYGLTKFFSKIIHITDGTPKSTFIKGMKVIFIEDSFVERADVFQNCPQAIILSVSVAARITL